MFNLVNVQFININLSNDINFIDIASWDIFIASD